MNSTKTKPRKPKLNVRLLRRIQKHILEEPKRFFMGWFIARGKPGTRRFTDMGTAWLVPTDLPGRVPPCGTAACIAGWANLFTGHRPEAHRMAQKELGITQAQGTSLFNAHYWPDPFEQKYRAAKTPLQRAKIAAARIEHLITKGETASYNHDLTSPNIHSIRHEHGDIHCTGGSRTGFNDWLNFRGQNSQEKPGRRTSVEEENSLRSEQAVAPTDFPESRQVELT